MKTSVRLLVFISILYLFCSCGPSAKTVPVTQAQDTWHFKVYTEWLYTQFEKAGIDAGSLSITITSMNQRCTVGHSTVNLKGYIIYKGQRINFEGAQDRANSVAPSIPTNRSRLQKCSSAATNAVYYGVNKAIKRFQQSSAQPQAGTTQMAPPGQTQPPIQTQQQQAQPQTKPEKTQYTNSPEYNSFRQREKYLSWLRYQYSQGYISKGRYAFGGLVGSVVGFGIGHAIHRHYKDCGWVFTLGEGAGLLLFLSTPLLSMFSVLDYGAVFGIGIGGIVLWGGFKIWEIVDVWVRGHKHIVDPKKYPGNLPVSMRFFPIAFKNGGGLGLVCRF
ncbi:MAG: hypothetical protein R6V85_00705 [Polyangia bacterium]